RRLTRAGPEVRRAGLEGLRDGVAIHPRHHQDVARVGFLHDGRNQALRVEAKVVDGHGASRTSTPRSRMYAFASAIVWIAKWKIDAASAASAPPSVTPSTRCSSDPAPPDAITGTVTASDTARVSSRS